MSNGETHERQTNRADSVSETSSAEPTAQTEDSSEGKSYPASPSPGLRTPLACPAEPGGRLRTALGLAAVAGFYTGVACILFHSVFGQLRTHLIGDGGDCFEFYWNAWWIDQSLLAGRNPYWCDMQFVPTGVPLVLHTLSLLPSTFIALAGRGLPLPVVYNLMVIGLYPLAGLCLFALARHITRDTAGALAGGLAFMMCPCMASKLVGHLNLQCAALLPLFTLTLLKAIDVDGRRWRWAVAGVFAVILLSNIHTAIFAGNVALWACVYFSIRERNWRGWLGRFAGALSPTLVIAGAWGVVIGLCVWRYRLDATPYAAPIWCPEPLSYVLPLHSTSMWKDWFPSVGSLWNLELAVYLGWLVLPLAVAGWWACRGDARMRLMTVLFIASLALSIGPKLQWNRQIVKIGRTPVRLPMNVYRYVPVLGSIGQTGRYLVIGYMAMGVGVAGAVALARRRRGAWAARAGAAAALGLVAADYAFVPVTVALPVTPIGAGGGAVMDPRLGEARALYHQTVHARPLMGGYIARIPRWVFEEYRSVPQLGWFFEPPDRRGPPPDPATVLPALRDRGIAYVCVGRGSADQKVLEASGLVPVRGEGLDVFLRVPTREERPLPESPARPRSGPS